MSDQPNLPEPGRPDEDDEGPDWYALTPGLLAVVAGLIGLVAIATEACGG